jgi:hypothetical protein
MLHKLIQNVSAQLQTKPTPTISRLETIHTQKISCPTATGNIRWFVLQAVLRDSDFAAGPEADPKVETTELGPRTPGTTPPKLGTVVPSAIPATPMSVAGVFVVPPPTNSPRRLVMAPNNCNCLPSKVLYLLIAISRLGDSLWTSAEGGQEYGVDATGPVSVERGT